MASPIPIPIATLLLKRIAGFIGRETGGAPLLVALDLGDAVVSCHSGPDDALRLAESVAVAQDEKLGDEPVERLAARFGAAVAAAGADADPLTVARALGVVLGCLECYPEPTALELVAAFEKGRIEGREAFHADTVAELGRRAPRGEA